jgi:hypothetical protein
MTAALDELLCTLLQEGCEVDPYEPDGEMNATAAPLGALYPAAFARANARLHADLRLEVAVQASEASTLAVNVLFVEPSDHRVREFAVTPEEIGELVRRPRGESRDFLVPVRACVQASRIGPSMFRIRVDVANETGLDDHDVAVLDEDAALRSSLLSTHVVLRVSPGRFVSPVETRGADGECARGCSNRNVWPVLFGRSDDTVIGAPIVLPDHPEIAFESPDIPFDAAELARLRRGDKVRLVLGPSSDPQAVVLDGRTATLERIYRGADASVHFAVSLDGDPGRDVIHDRGRLFYFRSNEVEALAPLRAPDEARMRV